MKETKLTWLTLFTTTGTLVCCAIPIILVSLGMGAVVASLINAFPFLITLSEHKNWVFLVSGVLLFISYWVIYQTESSCPTDPSLGEACNKVQVWNRRILWLSVLLWMIGVFAAYLALPVQIWFKS